MLKCFIVYTVVDQQYVPLGAGHIFAASMV